MGRGHRAISGWPAMLLAPFIFLTVVIFMIGIAPVALAHALLEAAGLIKRDDVDLSPEELAKYLRDFIEGTGDDRDWDTLENMRIEDPMLDEIRRKAVLAGPPNANIAKLKQLLAEAEALGA